MLAENKRYGEEVSRLKEFFKRLRVGAVPAPDGTMRLPDSERAVEVEVLAPMKSVDVDVTPLENFLSQEYLGDLRWKIGDDGALYEGKDRLTPVGFVPALEKLIAMAKQR